jgi:hypothetical protein
MRNKENKGKEISTKLKINKGRTVKENKSVKDVQNSSHNTSLLKGLIFNQAP